MKGTKARKARRHEGTYIHTYISLFKVDMNHTSLLTNKHRLKKKLQSHKLNISYIGDKFFI